MTQTELRTMFNDLLGEAAGKKTWLTAQADRWLDRSYRRKQRQYGLYLKTKAVQILSQRAEYLQSEVLPYLASGEIQTRLWSVQYQRGSNGLITSIVTNGGNAKFASLSASLVITGTRLELMNMISGNYDNEVYIGGAWDSSYFYVIDLNESVVGTCTSVEDGATDAVFTLAAHGLSTNNIIRLYDGDVYSEALYTVTVLDANTFNLTTIANVLVTYSADDTPSFQRVLQYDTSTDTGLFVLSSSYIRRTLVKAPWQEIQGAFNSFVTPTTIEVPLGTAFLNWWVVADTIATGEIPDTKFPEAYQEHIAIDAVKSALASTGDERLPNYLESEWTLNEAALNELSQHMHPKEEALAGLYYGLNGLYSYRPQTDRAFILAPRDN